MKRISFVLLAACVFMLAATSVAFANYGPHGGYTQDTDGCAACHRAHTSFSTLGWTESGGAQDARESALLISDSATMTDFCYACHGNAAPGASTNVQAGIFDSGPTGGVGDGLGHVVGSGTTTASVFYQSNSSYEATLNGGGFEFLGANNAAPVMSAHDMQGSQVGTATPWGFATVGGVSDLSPISSFRCTSCHDPHGSANYRLLKDFPNGVKKGGYDDSGTPDPWVVSNEQGFPPGGFKKGQAGVTEGLLYRPNYTSPQYAAKAGKSMSSWCSSCHTAYAQSDSSYNYGQYMAVNGTNLGAQDFHRHLVDIPLSVGMKPDADRALVVKTLDDPGLPLEMPLGEKNPAATFTSGKFWDERGNITCLTCHFAHGSDATMSGWAVAELAGDLANPAPKMLSVGDTGLPASQANPLGVNPNFSQALLRYDNRGVCERCHNK